MSAADVLDVYDGGRLVGRLFDERPLRFRYDPSWLKEPGAAPLSARLPLQDEDHAGDQVVAYFENLLPEGDIRRFLSVSRHATTVFGLLRSVGGDTAGGLTLMPQGEKPAPPRYRPTTWADIAAQLLNGSVPAFAAEAEGARISLAGAQDKLLIMVDADGNPAIPEGAAPSSHILKPDIRGLPGVWGSALNETLVMQLAARLELGVAPAVYQPDTRACLIRRYDRVGDGAGGLLRLHQLDFCQLAGKPSDVKYEADGGPTLALCRELLRRSGLQAGDLRRFLAWIFFNLYVGNNDSHAKNLSILQAADGSHRLAPFYDLMCTAMYTGLSRRFAFSIGGEMAPGRITADHLSAMAGELGFAPRYVMQVGKDVAARLPGALEEVTEALREQLNPGSETVLLRRLAHWIRGNTRKHATRWWGKAA
jgi:serine/threonine-protein kinase HipA